MYFAEVLSALFPHVHCEGGEFIKPFLEEYQGLKREREYNGCGEQCNVVIGIAI